MRSFISGGSTAAAAHLVYACALAGDEVRRVGDPAELPASNGSGAVFHFCNHDVAAALAWLDLCADRNLAFILIVAASAYDCQPPVVDERTPVAAAPEHAPLAAASMAVERATLGQSRARAVAVRLFGSVDPGDGSVVDRFVQQALDGVPLTVAGDGRQARAFARTADVMRAVRALVDAPEAVGHVVNVGARAAVPILGLARRVKQLTRTRAPILRVLDAGTSISSLRTKIPVVDKLERLIGWVPSGELDEVLLEVIAVARDAAGRRPR